METTQDTIDATMEAARDTREKCKRTIAAFKEEDEMKLIEFLRDNELLNNKLLKDYIDPNKREVLWDKFCSNKKMDKAA